MTPDPTFDLWVYLSEEPLLWLTLTLVAYVIGDTLSARANRHPLVNPVLIAAGCVGAVLFATDTVYERYFEGAQFVHFLLGPATIALAVPLYQHIDKVRRVLVPMIAALVAGSATAAASAMAIAWMMGASGDIVTSIAPKSVTMPIAMGIAETLGGIPTLTAVLVMLTGILGAVFAKPVMAVLRITDWQARGFAIGVTAHGMSTARAFQVNELAGTFAAIAMGLNGLATAVLVPIFATWF